MGRKRHTAEQIIRKLRETEVELVVPYDRLLGGAMQGDAILFAREDEGETARAIVDPILDKRSRVHEYEPGSWRPSQASAPCQARGLERASRFVQPLSSLRRDRRVRASPEGGP
jgi:glucose-6-phosphate 1-dehydrogenase